MPILHFESEAGVDIEFVRAYGIVDAGVELAQRLRPLPRGERHEEAVLHDQRPRFSSCSHAVPRPRAAGPGRGAGSVRER